MKSFFEPALAFQDEGELLGVTPTLGVPRVEDRAHENETDHVRQRLEQRCDASCFLQIEHGRFELFLL